MPAFDDDDDRDLQGSQDGDSDNDADETMRDLDDGDGDGDGDMDGDNDADGGVDGDGDEDDDAESQASGSQQSDNESAAGEADPTSTQDPAQQSSHQPLDSRPDRPNVRPEALTAATYDIIPTIAAPQSTSINAVCATEDMRWVFSGGSDGYIRKFNWVDSVNNKLALTVAQRHPFVDSVVKAAVLMTYWENWDASTRSAPTTKTIQALSPVYSLAVQSQALWLLSGTLSGAVRMQSIRHEEGREIALLHKHASAVSVLTLSSDEKSLLSGSWDKTVLDWDLETGNTRRTFAGSAGQISSIETRPLSSVPIPTQTEDVLLPNDTFSSNNQAAPLLNGIHSPARTPAGPEKSFPGSPDSLFGGDENDDDLFGDSADGVLTNGAHLGDDLPPAEDEQLLSQHLDSAGPAAADHNPSQDITMTDDDIVQISSVPNPEDGDVSDLPTVNGIANTEIQPLANGLPHAESMDADINLDASADADAEGDADADPTTENKLDHIDQTPTSDSTFLATSVDGAIRIWDRRQASPAARILPRNTPPFCLSACWSPDGNNLYAGRRNNTVEEFDIRGGLKGPSRVFRFPNGSGPVTSVRPMPNGRHLICASHDILRLYDLKESSSTRSSVPFLIVPGHRTGVISHLFLDPTCRFMISAGGNRGWEGSTTEALLGYEIAIPS